VLRVAGGDWDPGKAPPWTGVAGKMCFAWLMVIGTWGAQWVVMMLLVVLDLEECFEWGVSSDSIVGGESSLAF
jgi:hypothetical protein